MPGTRILITGAAGYIGSHLARHLSQNGFDVITAGRRGCQVAFDLNAPVWPKGLAVDAVMHAAWDLLAKSEKDAATINVDGSRKFFRLAAENGARVIFISSISAYEKAQSIYGQTKLRVEQEAADVGGISIRPGLVYGGSAGGIVRSLQNLVKRLPVLPVIDQGNQDMYSCHIEDLVAFSEWALRYPENLDHRVYTAASSRPLKFRSVLSALAQKETGHAPTFVSIPFWFIYFPLKCAEFCGVPLRTGSDNLISLLRSNPTPDFDSIRNWPNHFRPFAPNQLTV